MAASDYKNCNVCEAQSNASEAVKWCFECEEAFCTDCLKYHSTSKFTRSHAPIDIENYRSLPAYVLKIKQYCDEHGERFQNYCTTHDWPCCSKCIGSSHLKCNNLPSLNDVVQNAKTSTAITDIEERLRNLKCFFGDLFTEKENNILDLKSEKENILAQIKQIRYSLNQHLDKLENDITERLSEIESTHRISIDKTCTDLKKNENNAIELLDALVKMKEYASDFQNFLGRRKLEDDVKNIEDLITDEIPKTQHIVFQENSSLVTLQSNLSSFGELSVVARPSNIKKRTSKVDQAQINTTKLNNFDSLNLVIRQDIDIHKNIAGIFGCALVQNEKAVFTDFNESRLFVKDIQSSNMYTIYLPGTPYDITCIDETTLAVTSDNGITIVDLKSRKVKKRIDDTQCFGICSLNGNLVYSTFEHGLKMLDLSSYSIKRLNIRNWTCDEYIAARNNKIYCTNRLTSKVTCYNPDHSVAWVFQNLILKGPRGITIDDHFNVYIGGLDSNNVVVISPDGKKFKEFTLEIKRPRTLYFDEKSKNVLICGENGPAGIFSITM